MNGKEINGRLVYAGRAQKRIERQSELKRKFEQLKQERMSRYQVTGLNWLENLDLDILYVIIRTEWECSAGGFSWTELFKRKSFCMHY